MSKASKWAQTVNAQRPMLDLGGELLATVDETGALEIRSRTASTCGTVHLYRFSPAKAPILARWILDTFGDVS
jgi:hypothetical protein